MGRCGSAVLGLALLIGALAPAPVAARAEHVTLRLVVLCDGAAPLTATARLRFPVPRHADVGPTRPRPAEVSCDAAGRWIGEATIAVAENAAWQAEVTATAGRAERTCSRDGPGLPVFLACEAGDGLILVSASRAPGGDVPLEAPLPELSRGARADLFDYVWGFVAEYYVDLGDGTEWAALFDEYRPRALAAEDAEVFYAVLIDLVARLGDDHSRFLPPWQALAEGMLAGGRGTYDGVGFAGVYEPESLLVLYVFPDSPAEEVGIRPRDRIVAVDGRAVSAERAGLEIEERGLLPVYAFDGQPLVARSDPLAIRGRVGTTVKLTVLGPDGQTREALIERASVATRVMASGHRLGPDAGIGYLRIPSFFVEDMAWQVEAELRELLDAGPLGGLILDLRANPGGFHAVMEAVLGHFVEDEVARVGGRHGDQVFAFDLSIGRGSLFAELADVQVVVLVDGWTNSAAELVAGMLHADGRARVVGEPSAGNVEGLVTWGLPDGSALQVANSIFLLDGAESLEGRGVIPDVEVAADWTEVPEREDPYLAAALDLLADGERATPGR